MAVGYRAILRLERTDDAIAIAEEQLKSWLRSKRAKKRNSLSLDDWEGAGVHRLGPSSKLHVTHLEHAADKSRRRLYRLIEENKGGRWVVSIYATSTPQSREHPETIVVEGELAGSPLDRAVTEVATPNVVRGVLDTYEVHDGKARLTGEPEFVRLDNVESIIDAIIDDSRSATVMVAASLTPEIDNAWLDVVKSLTKQSVGLAAVYVVAADAVHELNRKLPQSHGVASGHVRTFFERVNLDDPTDGRRHPWLGPEAIAASIGATRGRVDTDQQFRHARNLRRRLLQAPVPSDVRRTMELLHRAELSILRTARVNELVAHDSKKLAKRQVEIYQAAIEVLDKSITKAPTKRKTQQDATESNWYERIAKLLSKWLGISKPELAHLDKLDTFVTERVAELQAASEQLDEAAATESTLIQRLTELTERAENFQLDLHDSEQQNVELERKVSILQSRLRKAERFDETYIDAEDDQAWQSPQNMDELVGRLAAETPHPIQKYVMFTGDRDTALQIDEHDTLGTYAERMWQYLRVLHDYAVARIEHEYSGNIHMYLKTSDVDGTKCDPSRHAAGESEAVRNNKKWRNERLLPVPKSVSENGLVFMESHFKPTHRDQFAPRMHYYDDLPRSGRIYVGYIGRHLTNTKT